MAGDDGHAGRGGVDLVAIRAELKSWERSFRTSHGREPGKDDIKAEPEIGGCDLVRSLASLVNRY